MSGHRRHIERAGRELREEVELGRRREDADGLELSMRFPEANRQSRYLAWGHSLWFTPRAEAIIAQHGEVYHWIGRGNGGAPLRIGGSSQ